MAGIIQNRENTTVKPSDIWYKCRSNGRAEDCRDCGNLGLYWMEPALYYINELGITGEHFKARIVCEHCITQDMLARIEDWDGGQELLHRVGYKHPTLKDVLRQIGLDGGWVPKVEVEFK